MSHSIFTVEFQDGFRMYGVNDGTGGCLHPFLFKTPDEVTAWIFSGNREECKKSHEPDNARLSEEPVTIGLGELWEFNSRASRLAGWITGPLYNADLLESWDDNLIYGV